MEPFIGHSAFIYYKYWTTQHPAILKNFQRSINRYRHTCICTYVYIYIYMYILGVIKMREFLKSKNNIGPNRRKYLENEIPKVLEPKNDF